MKKSIAIILCIISFSRLYSAQENTVNSEVKELKKREAELKKREAALKKKEDALKKKEKIYDRTNYQKEMQRREAARKERERRRKEQEKKYGTGLYQEDYFIQALGGISFNVYLNDYGDAEINKMGYIFGIEFLTTASKEKHIKFGCHISYVHSLIKINGVDGEMQTNGVLLLFFGQYEFIKRREGNDFIPFANLGVGLFFPKQSDREKQANSIAISAFAGGGFTYWIKNNMGITLKIKLLMAKFLAYPQDSDDTSNYNLFIVPTLSVQFAF